MTEPTKLYSAEAAAHVGVARSTWADYYSDGRTPGAVEIGPSQREGHPRRADGVDMDRGAARPYWYPATLDAWERPGRGAGGGRKPAVVVPPTIREVLATIRACTAHDPQAPVRPIPGEHPATTPIVRAELAADVAPFADLQAALDEYFGPELDEALSGPEADTAEAEMRRIIAEHVTGAQARLAAPPPKLSWSSRDSLSRVARTAIIRAGDLRFTEALGER